MNDDLAKSRNYLSAKDNCDSNNTNLSTGNSEDGMRNADEQILKVSKEIVVKFIEVGRTSPTNFDSIFKSVYKSVREAVQETE